MRLAFKPIGKRWADTAVDLGRPELPTRPVLDAGWRRPRAGRLAASIKRKTATQRKAAVGAHYTAYFIDAGVKPHSMTKRTPGVKQDRTVFAKKHPGYKARPFRGYIAHESLRRNPMAETLIEEWNRSA